MTQIDLNNLTVTKARKHLADGDFSAVELAENYLAEIERRNPELNAYIEVFDDVLEQAREADKKLQTTNYKLQTGLTGIPLAVKDNILIRGKYATAASGILKGHQAAYDATIVTKLKEHNPVFIGRANCDEFAMGASTENSAFGVTKNPHDTSRVAGGSSGGSTAAVAADLALAALGSDTGGSIRQPASLCGVVGLKPTYGAVSRNGLIALASSLDCIGPITKTVADAELLFGIIKGKDVLDSTTVDASDYPHDARPGTKDVVVGVPTFVAEADGLDPRVKKNFEASLEKLEGLGYTIEEVELPYIRYSVPTYYIILPAEASANLARFDGVKYGLHIDGDDLIGDYFATRGVGFGPEPQRRILIGTYVLSAGYHDAYYNKALAVRQKIREDFLAAFKKVDVIATPTTAGPAFPVGAKADDPVQMYLEDVFTAPANLAGVPALSVPSGTVKEGQHDLPLGMQFVAPHMHEEHLFSIGKKFLGEE